MASEIKIGVSIESDKAVAVMDAITQTIKKSRNEQKLLNEQAVLYAKLEKESIENVRAVYQAYAEDTKRTAKAIADSVRENVEKQNRAYSNLTTQLKELDLARRQGKITADQQTRSLVEITMLADKLGLSYKQYIAIQQQIYHVNQRTVNGFDSMGGSLNKIQQNMKMTNPAMISLNQIVQDSPFGLRGMGNNIQFLTQQFTQLRSSGMSTKEILGGMMRNVLTPMGGLMMAVSVGTSALTMAMDYFGKKTKVAKEETSAFNEQLEIASKNISSLSKQQAIDSYKSIEKQIKLLEAQYTITTGVKSKRLEKFGYVPKEGEAISGTLDSQFGKMIEITSVSYVTSVKAMSEADKQRYDSLKKLLGIHEEYVISLEKEEAKRVGGKYGADSSYLFQSRFGDVDGSFLNQDNGLSPFQRSFLYEPSPNLDKKSKAYVRRQQFLAQMRNDNAKQREEDAKDERKKQEDNLRSAMDLYNSLFFNPIRAGFDAVINKSGSFADAFIGALKKMMAQLLEFAVLAGILSFIFPSAGFGAIFGQLSGLKGAMPTQTVSKRVVGNMSNSGRANAIEIYGETDIKDDHIRVSYKRANARKKALRA